MGQQLTRNRRWIRAIVAATIACSGVVSSGSTAGASTSLSVVASPSPGGPPVATLNGVSCPSTTLCLAVGAGADGGSVIEQWNGTSWTTDPSPDPTGQDASLSAVSCATTTYCVAVGVVHNTDPETTAETPLIEQWNGTTWTVATSPSITEGALASVSCSTPTSCFAVGGVNVLSTLVEQWDGTKWSVVNAPMATGPEANFSSLSSVSCASTTSCVAVAVSGAIETWNGTKWSLVADVKGEFLGVSCASATMCFAVGIGNSALTFIERFNGTSWSTSPNPKLAGELDGVSCASATSCLAVGEHGSGPTISEHWNGTTWSVVKSPSPDGFESMLPGVSCGSATNCIAVGSFQPPTFGPKHLFTEQWNGTSWSLTAPPSDVSQSALSSVSCVSATNCFAVGTDSSGYTEQTLIEHWNGTTWSVMASPNASGTKASSLVSISCSSATNCLAVGSAQAQFVRTLVERWNGAHWSIVKNPKITTSGGNELSGVSCVSSTTCFAVGFDDTIEGTEILIERWNGTTLSATEIANPFGFEDFMSGVSCASTMSCVAVGSVRNDAGSVPLLAHWNGKTWSVAKEAPQPPLPFPSAVSCISNTSCLAVGNGLGERWNGKPG